ncbi:MAG: hypothetical protein ACR2RF_26385 [Geminicoccaceae bacterium]
MGEITDRLLGAPPQQRPPPPEGGPLQSAVPPFVGAQGEPTRLPQTPEESRITERLLGSRESSFAPPLPENTATRAEFDFPEITQVQIPGLEPGQTVRLAAGLLFAIDEGQQEDIIRSNLPGSEIDRDRFGNLFARIPGVETPVYINRPGPSPQDFTQLGAMIGPAVRVGQAGAAVGSRFLGPLVGQAPGRVAGTAAAESALSAGTDVALQATGSEQPVNVGRAIAAGAFGAGGEVLIPGLVRVLSSVGRRGARAFSTEGGRISLTSEARAAIEDAGLNPNTLSQDLITRLNAEVQSAAVPAQAQRVAEAASLPSPVPLTRGNITRQPNDQMFEDLAAKGSFGRTVQSIIQGTRDAQQTALRESAEQIQGGLSGGQAQVLQRGQGGEIVSQAINEIRDNADNVVQAAYTQARSSGQAAIPGNAIPSLAFNLERAAADRLPNAPQATAVVNELRQLGQEVGPDGAVLVGPLFDWRRRVTTLASDMAKTNPTEAGALRSIRNAFDAQIVDLVEGGILQGNEQAVDLWLTAIRRRREFGQIFEAANRDSPNYLVDLLTEQIPGGEAGRVLRFEPDQAANAIFGVTNTGFINRPQFARQIAQLESVLKRGGREDAWNAIREEAFARLVGQAEGPFVGSTNTRSFSGASFARAIDQAMERNRPAMMALFTPEELNLIAQLQRTALAATTVTSGGANFSNTAVAQSQIFRSTLGRLFGRLFGPALQSAAETVPLGNLPALLRAQGATMGRVPRRPGLPAGVGGGIGAVTGPPATEELQRRF